MEGYDNENKNDDFYSLNGGVGAERERREIFMNNDLKDIEDTIMKIIESYLGEKYSFAYKLENIEELPIKDFSIMQDFLSSGQAIIRMAYGSIDGTTFDIISTPTEKWLVKFYMYLTYLGPVIGIILSFMYSWYWLSLIIICPVVGLKLTKKAYLHALFNRAFNSEIVFSFLFTSGNVTIELVGQGMFEREFG